MSTIESVSGQSSKSFLRLLVRFQRDARLLVFRRLRRRENFGQYFKNHQNDELWIWIEDWFNIIGTKTYHVFGHLLTNSFEIIIQFDTIFAFQIPQTSVISVENPLQEVGFSLINEKIIVFLLYCVSVGFCFGALSLQFL